MARRKKKRSGFWKYFGKSLLFVVKVPYYAVKGVVVLSKGVSKGLYEGRVRKKRGLMAARYSPFKILETLGGDYRNWFDEVVGSESQIGIVLGARGSGKTAFGVKILENIYSRRKQKCFAMGFKAEEFPSWIRVVSDISELENNSWVLIDEGGVLFSSRSSMSSANKLLSQLILVARHKNINIIFIFW